MTQPPPADAVRDRRIAAALLVVTVVVAAQSAFVALPAPCWERVHPERNPVVMALCVVAAFAPLALAAAARRLWRRAAPARGPLLRAVVISTVALWLGLALATGEYEVARVGVLALAWSTWTGALLWRMPAGRPGPVRRRTRLLLAAALTLPLAELGLRAVALLVDHPLLLRSGAASERRLQTYQYAPGEVHYGFPCNELGFYDESFAAPPRQQPAVAVIGDSFSASFVPHAMHYTTIAEQALVDEGFDAAVWNVGWAAIGPLEYRILLGRYVLPRQPDLVVVSLFLGNDLAEAPSTTAAGRAIRDWFDRGNLLVVELPRRLWRACRERGEVPPAAGPPEPLEAVVRRHPWLRAPLREPGTFTPEAYLRLETERAEVYSSVEPRRWRNLTDALLGMKAMTPAGRFAVALIPDEAMVEDALWRRLEANTTAPLDRHALRTRLAAWCAEHDIPCLDLLPALRAVPPLDDGDRHLYLLRDTHWNARGNAVAGRALAPFLAQLLRRERR